MSTPTITIWIAVLKADDPNLHEDHLSYVGKEVLRLKCECGYLDGLTIPEEKREFLDLNNPEHLKASLRLWKELHKNCPLQQTTTHERLDSTTILLEGPK